MRTLYNCDQYLELISAAADGVLTPGELKRLNGHLEKCEYCRSLMREMENISRVLSTDEVVSAPEGFLARVMEEVEQTPQQMPFTALTGEETGKNPGRESLKEWWKPLLRTGGLAACTVILFGVVGLLARGMLGLGGMGAETADQSAADEEYVADSAEIWDETPDMNAEEDVIQEDMDAGGALPPTRGDADQENSEEPGAAAGFTVGNFPPLGEEIPLGVMIITGPGAETEAFLGEPELVAVGVEGHLITAETWQQLQQLCLDESVGFESRTEDPDGTEVWVYVRIA